MSWKMALAAAFLASGSFALGALTLTPETDAQDKQMTPEEQQAAMKRWQDACTPGDAHERLAQFLGEWETETALTMYGKTMKSKGTAKTRWLVEGRWLLTEMAGEMMGQPVETFVVHGFDNFKKKYVTTMVDSLTTHMLRAEGIYNTHTEAFYTFGLMDEPLTMEHDKTVRYVTKFSGKDSYTFEIHDLDINVDDNKVVETKFRRKKSRSKKR